MSNLINLKKINFNAPSETKPEDISFDFSREEDYINKDAGKKVQENKYAAEKLSDAKSTVQRLKEFLAKNPKFEADVQEIINRSEETRSIVNDGELVYSSVSMKKNLSKEEKNQLKDYDEKIDSFEDSLHL